MSNPVIFLETRGGFCEFLAANVDLNLWAIDYDVIKGSLDPNREDAADLARSEFKRGSSHLLKRAVERLETLPWIQHAAFVEAGVDEEMFMPIITSDPVEVFTVVEKGMAHGETTREGVQIILVDHDERTVSACDVTCHTPNGLAEARNHHLAAIRHAFELFEPETGGPSR